MDQENLPTHYGGPGTYPRKSTFKMVWQSEKKCCAWGRKEKRPPKQLLLSVVLIMINHPCVLCCWASASQEMALPVKNTSVVLVHFSLTWNTAFTSLWLLIIFQCTVCYFCTKQRNQFSKFLKYKHFKEIFLINIASVILNGWPRMVMWTWWGRMVPVTPYGVCGWSYTLSDVSRSEMVWVDGLTGCEMRSGWSNLILRSIIGWFG